jgi:hypothetical protein
MVLADLDKRAELTVWPGREQARTARGQAFSTLREALAAAAESLQANDAQPWIITEDGDILSPRWIEANADPHRLQ